LPLAVLAQEPSSNGKKIMYAMYTQDKITIDGELTEPAWQTAEPAKDFVQREPIEGAPASDSTEVRILYDGQNLYIGAYCHDRDPQKIVINDISRDFDNMGQGIFGVLLDTFNDKRTGYLFQTTPVGAQRDAQISDEGRSSNVNWDGVWYSEGRVQEDGYVVEIAIPFKTLRFSGERVQVWGVQFVRRIRHINELDYWIPMPRRFTLARSLPYVGELRGIENVEPGRNLYVKPYVLGGVQRLASRGEEVKAVGLAMLPSQPGDWGGEGAGVDLKYGITPSMTFDLTVNTDFSHVEADTQQVNLTRFPLFFPEKREFFLENSGLFQFGATQGNEALLFHSRTIGLADGQPIPILGGARLTGRAAGNYLGLLNIQTRSEGSVPATNFTATRLRRDILSNSNVGLIFLNRQSGQPNDHNRSFGADANLLFFRTNLRFSALAAKTLTPALHGNDWLGKVEGEWQSSLVRFLSSYLDVEKNFNPEMGFVRRPGRRTLNNEFELQPRPRPETRLASFVRDLSASIASRHILLPDGSTETKSPRPHFRVEFQDGGIFQSNYTQNFERLIRPFEIHREVVIPAGDYPFEGFSVSYTSDESKLLFGDLSYGWGDFYDGESTTLNLGVRFRPNYRLSTSIDYQRNEVDLPAGAFTIDLVGLRMDYSFNPRMFMNAFVQYSSDTNQVSSNIRFRLIHRPLSDIYIVYNEQRDPVLDKTDWSLTLKYTHLVNF